MMFIDFCTFCHFASPRKFASFWFVSEASIEAYDKKEKYREKK